MAEPIFIDGMRIFKPHENAPDFVIGSISIDRAIFQVWLNNQTKQKINIDVKRSKKGNYYAQLNTFEPKPRGNNDIPDDVPF